MDSKEPRVLLVEVRRTGMTQNDVAKEIGVTQGSVSKLEKGLIQELRSNAFRKLLELHKRVVKPVQENRQLSQIRAPKAAASAMEAS